MTHDWVIDLGVRICEQWGINPADCFDIVLHWEPGSLPWAEVKLRLNEGVVREVLTLAPVVRIAVIEEIVG